MCWYFYTVRRASGTRCRVMDCCRSFFRPFILNLKRPIGPRGLRALRSEFQQAWWISAMLPTFLILEPFLLLFWFPSECFSFAAGSRSVRAHSVCLLCPGSRLSQLFYAAD